MLHLYVTKMQYIITISFLLMFTTTITGKTGVELKGPNVCDKVEDINLNLKRIEELSDGDMVFPDEFKELLNNQNLTKSITKECCAGYTKNKIGDRCIPFCAECKYGDCVAPEECRCYPGFKGPSCNISCPHGYHGQDCSHKCSCRNDASCRKDNGFCECRPGFIGTNCEIVCPEGADCLQKQKPDTVESIWRVTTPYLAGIILCVISIVGVIVCALICYHHKVINPSTIDLKHQQQIQTTGKNDPTNLNSIKKGTTLNTPIERTVDNIYTPFLNTCVPSKPVNIGRSNLVYHLTDTSPKDAYMEMSSPTATAQNGVYLDMENRKTRILGKSYKESLIDEEPFYDEIIYQIGSKENDEYHHLNHLGATSMPKQHYQQISCTHNEIENKTKVKSFGRLH